MPGHDSESRIAGGGLNGSCEVGCEFPKRRRDHFPEEEVGDMKLELQTDRLVAEDVLSLFGELRLDLLLVEQQGYKGKVPFALPVAVNVFD